MDFREFKLTMLIPQNMGKCPLFKIMLDSQPCKRFEQPEFSMYNDVTSDPYLLIQEFENKVVLYGNDKSLLCKFFSATL